MIFLPIYFQNGGSADFGEGRRAMAVSASEFAGVFCRFGVG
jgi:hypothetical protein